MLEFVSIEFLFLTIVAFCFWILEESKSKVILACLCSVLPISFLSVLVLRIFISYFNSSQITDLIYLEYFPISGVVTGFFLSISIAFNTKPVKLTTIFILVFTAIYDIYIKFVPTGEIMVSVFSVLSYLWFVNRKRDSERNLILYHFIYSFGLTLTLLSISSGLVDDSVVFVSGIVIYLAIDAIFEIQEKTRDEIFFLFAVGVVDMAIIYFGIKYLVPEYQVKYVFSGFLSAIYIFYLHPKIQNRFS